jgi:hypothetical protein
MRALTAAIAASMIAAAWLAVNVAGAYGGDWSGLFYTGAEVTLPGELEAHTRRVDDPAGYDGQFYHLLAHDPLMRRGFTDHIDNLSLRWRRIGVPALAWLLAGGNDGAVDYVFVAIQMLFVFLGTFWLARHAEDQGRNAAWGLAFLLVPAVSVSLDRMTIDLPLAALTVAFALYAAEAKSKALYAILALAPLVRETGIILAAGWFAHSALRRDRRAMLLCAAASAPAIAWWAYVRSRTWADGTNWYGAYPLSGIIERTIVGSGIPPLSSWLETAAVLEEVANAGMWLAFALAGYLAWKRSTGHLELTAILFALFASMLGRLDIWTSAYAAGRTMSPLLLLLGLLALRGGNWIFAAPLALMLPRIALQYQAQLKSAIEGLN